jgi:hypothetical protein
MFIYIFKNDVVCNRVLSYYPQKNVVLILILKK